MSFQFFGIHCSCHEQGKTVAVMFANMVILQHSVYVAYSKKPRLFIIHHYTLILKLLTVLLIVDLN
jgi:hypothetical protein